jgi:putative ABC transport system ATP-binding protein
MLIIEDVTLTYTDRTVFSHFNMTVENGEVVCLSGESGCGKTSILNAILGFVPYQAGSIIVDDIVLSPITADKVRQRIAWLPQELALPSEKVSEMVQLPFLLKANSHLKFSKEALFGCFEALGIEQKLYDKNVSEISGGQRQRIMIAVASLLDKPLLIADEPTSALDAGSAVKVMQFFQKLTQNGKAILLVSHDTQVAQMADRQIILQRWEQ